MLLGAGIGFAVLIGASVCLVLLLPGAPVVLGRAPDLLTPGAPPPGSARAAPPAADSPPPRAAPGVDVGKGRARWTEPTEETSAKPMAGRAIRKVVRRALLAPPVQQGLSRCVERYGGFGGSPSPRAVPRASPAVLMLEMETEGSGVRIVEAEVQEWGGASAEVVSCAKGVLLGRVIAAAVERPGERVRMPFPLSPRAETVKAL
jgi:hypothetical protein